MNVQSKVQAVVLTMAAKNFGGVSLVSDLSAPSVMPDEDNVVIQMKSSRINPVDLDLTAGLPFLPTKNCNNGHPQIVGVDGAGTITQVGSKSQDKFAVGDQVFVYRPFADFGTWATQVSIPAVCVAKAPSKLPLEAAGAVSLTAATTYDALFHSLAVEKKKSILILGAGGGVGFSAVQFAVHTGLKVYCYASKRDEERLLQAGAVQVVDYKTEDLLDCVSIQPGQMDYILDASGKTSLSELAQRLQPTKLCSVKHPNADAMAGVGIELSWFWRTLFGILTWKDSHAAKAANVDLIGQVTPAGHPTLLRDVSQMIDDMKGSFVPPTYQTLTFQDIEAAGGMSEKDVGKVIVF